MLKSFFQDVKDSYISLLDSYGLLDGSFKRRLRQMRQTKFEEMPEIIHETEGDNFLRGSMLSELRAKRLGVGRKIGLSYWRHGHNSACRSAKCEEYQHSIEAQRQNKFYDRENYHTIKGIGYDVAQPGMGLEQENFSSFLSNVNKEQALRNHFNNNKKNVSEGDYTISHASQRSLEGTGPYFENNALSAESMTESEAKRQGDENQKLSDLWPRPQSASRRLRDGLQDVRSALLDMVQDSSPAVRAEVAENPNTPPEAMWVLAKDEDALVRSRVAANANTPVAVLEALANDENVEVEEKAVRTLRRLWARAHEGIAGGELSGISRLPELPQERNENVG